MQAIRDYEIAHNIPIGWVNFSISRTSPNGAWHRLERGEIPTDSAFFSAFKSDLQKADLWEEYHRRSRSSNSKPVPESDSKSIAETTPPVPDIDAEFLFWEMMRVSRTPDPDMYPALLNLRRSNKFLLAALSNTVIFPAGHPWNERNADDVRNQFDIFISSAHVGLRKPDPKIYDLALAQIDEWDRRKGGQGIKPGEVLFLDDIGTNLKGAREKGMRTLKVDLGKGREAVSELEKITGLQLLGQGVMPKL